MERKKWNKLGLQHFIYLKELFYNLVPINKEKKCLKHFFYKSLRFHSTGEIR